MAGSNQSFIKILQGGADLRGTPIPTRNPGNCPRSRVYNRLVAGFRARGPKAYSFLFASGADLWGTPIFPERKPGKCPMRADGRHVAKESPNPGISSGISSN